MSEDIQKIEFDAFISKDEWPISQPFTEDKELGGFIDFGETTITATPGSPKSYVNPKLSWPPIKIKITIERVIEPVKEKKPNAKKTT